MAGALCVASSGCNEEFYIDGLVDLVASPAGPYTQAQTVTLSIAAFHEEIERAGVAYVQFYMKGEDPACTDTEAPFTCDWPITGADNGQHTWIARAHGDGGVSWRSPELVLSVEIDGSRQNPPPPSAEAGLIGSLPGVGTVTDVAVVGSRAFVASEEYGLAVIDVSNPNQLEIIAVADVPFKGTEVDSNGSVAVVGGQSAAGNAHLWVLDVTGPPTVLGEVSTTTAVGLAAGFLEIALSPDGMHAVAARGVGGVSLIDLSNPANPTIVDTKDTPGTAWGATIRGDLAYISDGPVDEPLKIYRVENAGTLSLVGQAHNTTIIARTTALYGNYAYVGNQNGGAHIADITNPLAPTMVSSMWSGGFVHDVEVEGSTLVLAVSVQVNGGYSPGEYWLRAYSLTDPLRPALLGSTLVSTGVGLDRLEFIDGKVYAAVKGNGLKVYGIGSGDPTFLGDLSTLRFTPWAIASDGNLAVVVGKTVATDTAELQVVDVFDFAAPAVLGSLATNDYQTSSTGFQSVTMHPSGNFAYVARGLSGFSRLDLSNPEEPVFTETHNDGGAVYAVTLNPAGTRAYVAAGPDGVKIYALDGTGSATLIGSKSLTGVMRDIAVIGDYLVVANQMGGVKFVDASDPAAMVQLSGKSTTGFCFYAAISGNIAVLMTDNGVNTLLDIFDISDQRRPAKLSTVAVGPAGGANGLEIDDAGRVFVATGENVVQVYDISTPTTPALLEEHGVVGSVQGLSLSGGLVYVADDATGLSIVNAP